MKGSANSFQVKIAQIDFNYRMASSTDCNCTRNIIQFTANCKIFLSLMLLLVRSALSQLDNPTEFQFWTCTTNDSMNRSALKGNLKVVLKSLVENVNKTGYNISSHGQNGDKVYGLAQCRGDLNASACRACVSNATMSLPQDCRGSFSIMLTGCFLRYDTENLYPKLNLSDTSFRISEVSCGNGTKTERSLVMQFDKLLTRVVDDAVSSNVGYSTLNESGLYSLAQCWRDLTMYQCNQCLGILYTNLSFCSPGATDGSAVAENCECMIRFAKHKFYGDGTPLLSTPTGTGTSLPPSTGPLRARDEGQNHPHLSLMLRLSIVAAVIVVALLGTVVIWKRKVMKRGSKKQLPGYHKPSSELSIAISKSKLNYKFQTLQIATKNFSPTNKIGQGGFGSVYKGVIPDGKEIAIKRLFVNREESASEFFNEVNLISCVQHKNLVKLLGCSVDGPDKLLVYEYLPNKSLDHFLFDKKMGNMLDWQRRFEIILGTASGLAYLHQESDIRIIHRDIKASNILLDHHFKPKIADFGLVRYFDEDETHLSTGIVGTRGYMAPEYLVHGHLTEKVDVYAFGVLVLEIVSGRRNKTPMHVNDIPSLLTMVWNCHMLGTLSSIIDPNIQESYHEVLQVVHIALLCTQTSAILRPSMSEVTMFLINREPNLPEASEPPFIDAIHLQSNINTSVASSHSKSTTSISSNHSHSNTSTCISPTLHTHNLVSNIASLSTASMSLNTISTSSFGPR